VVKPRDARQLLAVGNTYLYELIAAGELDSFRDGRARKITLDSIRRYIARRLAADR
jgi:excisionase family DNA binding protein